MMRRAFDGPQDLVRIDGDTLDYLCPWHGLQVGAAYAEGRAPCGCEWVRAHDGTLRAVRVEPATKTATPDPQ